MTRSGARWRTEIPSLYGPITVLGAGPLAGAERAIVTLHGMERSAARYLRQGAETAPEAIVLAPEFDSYRFPGWRSYNLARMLDHRGRPRPRRETLWPILASVVAYARGLAPEIAVYGHSAGAQLLQRWALFDPATLAGATLVAANPGWTTAIEPEVAFPYGLRGAPEAPDLTAAMRLDLKFLAGEKDRSDDHRALRRDPGADRQGRNRRARAAFFIRTARAYARKRGLDLNWSVSVAPGVGHSNAEAFEAAMPFIDSAPS